MSIEHIARIDIGRELTGDEISELCENNKEDDIDEIHDSGRSWQSVWSKTIWDIAEERIIKIDINELNKAYKKAVEQYGDRAEIIFSLNFN